MAIKAENNYVDAQNSKSGGKLSSCNNTWKCNRVYILPVQLLKIALTVGPEGLIVRPNYFVSVHSSPVKYWNFMHEISSFHRLDYLTVIVQFLQSDWIVRYLSGPFTAVMICKENLRLQKKNLWILPTSENNRQPQTEFIVSFAARKNEVESFSKESVTQSKVYVASTVYINVPCKQQEYLIYDRGLSLRKVNSVVTVTLFTKVLLNHSRR